MSYDLTSEGSIPSTKLKVKLNAEPISLRKSTEPQYTLTSLFGRFVNREPSTAGSLAQESNCTKLLASVPVLVFPIANLVALMDCPIY